MKSALKTLLRRLITLALMIGPFAVPAEAETVQDRLWSAINAQDAPAAATFCATFAAPPSACLVSRTRTTGTGASGEMRSTSPRR